MLEGGRSHSAKPRSTDASSQIAIPSARSVRQAVVQRQLIATAHGERPAMSEAKEWHFIVCAHGCSDSVGQRRGHALDARPGRSDVFVSLDQFIYWEPA